MRAHDVTVAPEPAPTDEIAVLPLAGDLDLSSAGAADRAIRRAEVSRPAVLVLDLRRVTFLDSTMLRTIVAAHVRARGEGRRLAVAARSETVRRVFRITLLEWRLEIVDDPADVRADRSDPDRPRDGR
ncbi:MAG: STAS domain-containing protein [Actinomycetota bacterium]